MLQRVGDEEDADDQAADGERGEEHGPPVAAACEERIVLADLK